jgi:murein DD-endopeptidase MepM/ murein hydrolase activator NlpD
VANHRAAKRGLSRRRSDVDRGGKRRAGQSDRTHSGGPKTLIPGIVSAPTLIGAGAIALAVVGALTVSAAEGASPISSGEVRKVSAAASMLTGANAGTDDHVSARLLSGRARAVSRDSRREAEQAATDERLQALAERQAEKRKAALAEVAAKARRQAAEIARKAWHLPVAPAAYHLTARFGQCSGLWSHCHTGLDFAAASGTPIRAVASGKVVEAGPAGAYGNRTVVTLDDGTQLWYCHQTTIEVTKGEQIRGGQFIGTVGATGNTTGPHLHLEVRPRPKHPIDPFAALLGHGLTP